MSQCFSTYFFLVIASFILCVSGKAYPQREELVFVMEGQPLEGKLIDPSLGLVTFQSQEDSRLQQLAEEVAEAELENSQSPSISSLMSKRTSLKRLAKLGARGFGRRK